MAKYHPTVDPYVVSRVRALESLLLEKGILKPGAVDAVVQRYQNDTGPLIGAKAVAKAWTDSQFRELLIENPTAAFAHFELQNQDLLRIKANSADVHNLVVCTLCSCYPWAIMGLPPVWYKAPPYRSRAVLEPRILLREMGLDVPEAKEIRVWDSSAELRYMVLPERPAGSEHLSEAELVTLITRDALIGVENPTF